MATTECVPCAAARAKVTASVNETMMRVRCTNCNAGLRSSGGITYPIHRVPLLVTETQLALWKAAGYVFTVE